MPSNTKTPLLKAQAEVDEVVDIMRDNIDKALSRDANITDLQDKSDHLKFGAKRFGKTATSLRNRMWWKNAWFRIVCILVCLIITGVILWQTGVFDGKKDD